VFLYINLIGTSYQCIHPTHYQIIHLSLKGFVYYVQKDTDVFEIDLGNKLSVVLFYFSATIHMNNSDQI